MSVILPGSYDPVTVGHLDIIRRALAEDSEVFVVAFVNDKKIYRFTESERLEMLRIATRDLVGVKVDFSDGTVVDYMRLNGIGSIVKGYRNGDDLAWERLQAEYNESHGGYKTLLLPTSEEFASVSSTLVRQRLDRGEDIDGLVPDGVADYIRSLNR